MDDNLPQKIQSYQIVRVLGKGGMGAVYEGINPQLGRRVAIKVLLSQFSNDKEQVARFFNEAKASNLVRHPSLVDVFECGYAENGTAFIIMEYLDGETLRARCKRQGALGGAAIPIIRQMATALAATHEQKIVHRDLKPDNVMVVADPEVPGGERVKILDFGIAKLLAETGGEEPQVRTRTGTMMGTPTYMSPEQCRGHAAVRQPSDVYSLGVMLFELYAGQPPFVSDGFGELAAMHLFASPPLLSSQMVGVPPALDALLVSMLAKDPGLRPTMSQVAEQLSRMPSDGKPVRQHAAVEQPVSKHLSQTTMLQLPTNQHRRKWLGGLLTLAIGIALLSLVSDRLHSQRGRVTASANAKPTVATSPTGPISGKQTGNELSPIPRENPSHSDEPSPDRARKPTIDAAKPERAAINQPAVVRKKNTTKVTLPQVEPQPDPPKTNFKTQRLD